MGCLTAQILSPSRRGLTTLSLLVLEAQARAMAETHRLTAQALRQSAGCLDTTVALTIMRLLVMVILEQMAVLAGHQIVDTAATTAGQAYTVVPVAVALAGIARMAALAATAIVLFLRTLEVLEEAAIPAAVGAAEAVLVKTAMCHTMKGLA